MIYKRGFLVGFVFIVFLLLSLEINALSVNTQSYVAIGGVYDEDGNEDWCDNSNVEIRALAPKGTKPGWHGDNDWGPNTQVPSDKGCWFLVIDVDDGDQNDNGWEKSYIGAYFNALGYTSSQGYETGYDDDDNDAWDCVLEYEFTYHNALLCSDDHFWHECRGELSTEGKTGDVGTLTWVDNKVYNCTLDEQTGFPLWKNLLGYDVDHDGHTTADCDDNPSDDPVVCTDLTIDQCSVTTFQCAICINPDGKEVAGDGADNDCKDGDVTDPDNSKETCINPDQNLFGEAFSWVESSDGGSCCGDDGTSELGTTIDAKQGQMLCVNKDKSFVGRSFEDIPGWNTEKCQGDWCWINFEK